MYVFCWNSILALTWFLLINSSFSSKAFCKWSLLFVSIYFKKEGNSIFVSYLAFKLLFYFWIFDFLDLILEKLLFFDFLVFLFFTFFEWAIILTYCFFSIYYDCCWIYWWSKGWTSCDGAWILGWKSAGGYYPWA